MKHVPIDYGKWDFSGKGKNIESRLNPRAKQIMEKSMRYQDKRIGETGHMEIVTYFALELLGKAGGNCEIIIPTAILHDIGWSQLGQSVTGYFYLVKGFDMNNTQMRRNHELSSVKLARKLLEDMAYPDKYIPAILMHIDGHDTRKDAFSHDDRLNRDADKLWRYTLPQVRIQADLLGNNLKSFREKSLINIEKPEFFHHSISRKMASTELDNAIGYWKANQERISKILMQYNEGK